MKLEIGERSYWYEMYGDGEPIVLLHGFTGSTKTWTNFINTYQGKFKMIVIDLPGHGKTKTSTPVTMEQCCHDIHHILENIGIQTYHLVGYSMGGRTALTYATFYQNELKSLILESASPGIESERERKNRIEHDEKLALKLEEEGLEAFIDYWENIPLFDTQKRLSSNLQMNIREERLSQTVEGLALSLRSMGTGVMPSLWDTLPSTKIPVLLLVGELDTKFVVINKKMQKSLSNSTLQIINGVGHAIHVESETIFGKMVEEFVVKSNTNTNT
ncbi:2-succinyl-6-hydroxy-2,4-cyclohexadiene-1-carboxylate synthase [Ornithinibacillus halotolerans]|uniref:Putative 2-succinyl-6-hydroxy-2,4-cyclohexadiene-1-carboxylate synthase n=1 Tax=Ornithinibacillus halotolerans TaxID=1274357 RepID=A0A916RY08_9BACI|nr:2-succinyl-6-hydroxy-2,4-cyclohexadiene-1-carboxylate synthase [Ornithinibacillus halotolerans]GGA76451.1 putative 2-succinyl-6-hydroxy-2,4-cyclohexadiene-1-carboxylate synthase [Ornithinibacillus halotolerans]